MKFNLKSSYKKYVIPIVTAALAVATAVSAQTTRPKKGTIEYKIWAANKIDSYVAEVFKKHKLPVPKVVNDAKFVRRASLLLNGRIPTLEEVRAYQKDTNQYKRDMLLQRLLFSKGYDSHMTNYVYDLLRVKESFANRNRPAGPYLKWIRSSVENNKPWDKMVRELITAKGSIWENGAVGYYIRDKGMPLDNLANTMRLFNGTRMECAQCHDHPYNDTDRKDFYQLAAFSNGLYEINKGAYNSLWKQIRDAKQERTDFGRFVQFIGDNVHYTSLQGAGIGRIKLPSDYQYHDGKPHEWVGARAPYYKPNRMTDRRDSDDGRKKFAEWLVKNDRFASITANRLWKRIMGTGLYEPADEYVEPEKTISRQLTRFLIELIKDLKYDTKQFQHIILLTKTFTFESSRDLRDPSRPYHFNGRQLQRMTAEQIWDSFVTLAKGNPDSLPTRSFSNAFYYRNKPALVGQKDMKTISKEILAIKDASKLRQYLTNLHRQVKTTSGKGSSMMVRNTRPGPLTGMVRASELASPAPSGHMLREFGQSDRDLIQNSTTEPNVNQVLSILNGHVEKLIISDAKSHVYKSVKKENTVEQNITNLFLATLTREPSKIELMLFKEEVRQSGEKGYRNILSALLTSREFLFVQ